MDFPGADGRPLVAVGQHGSLSNDTLKEIVQEEGHDAHGIGGDTGVGLDLFQHLVDVNGIGLISLGNNFSGLGSLGSLSGLGSLRSNTALTDN